jgi:hypothetical protein
MNISAPILKAALKKLGPVKTEVYTVSDRYILGRDTDVLVLESCSLGLGEFNINGKKFSQVINRMSGNIEITRDDKKLVIKSAKAKIELEIFQIKTPVLPEIPAKTFRLDAEKFKSALASASAYASPAKSAAFGDVVLIQSLPLGIEETSPSGYRIVGTDSIIEGIAEVEYPLPSEFKILLNLTAASAVRLMDSDKISFGETNTALYFESPDTKVFAAKPLKTFPDHDKLLALPTVVKYGFDPEELLSALKTIEPLIDESVDDGAISLHFRDNVVECSSVGVGSTALDQAGCEQIDPDPIFDPREIKIKMLHKRLSGFLSKTKGQASLGLTSHPVRLESNGVVVLTMPVKDRK